MVLTDIITTFTVLTDTTSTDMVITDMVITGLVLADVATTNVSSLMWPSPMPSLILPPPKLRGGAEFRPTPKTPGRHAQAATAG